MEKYLLAETPEAIEMREKIKQMIISRENENIVLAVQLIKGGGLHLAVMPYLWILAFAREHTVKANKINSLLKKALQPDTYILFTKMKRKFKKEVEWEYTPEDDWAEESLQEIISCEETTPYIKDFAIAFLYLLQMGSKYILRHKILSEEAILRAIIRPDGLLSFANFGLETLPACIGQFTTVKRLDLSENPLSDVPDSLANLKNLEQIYLDKDLPEFVMDKLDSFLPKAMSNYYQKMGNRDMDFNEIEKAIAKYEKAVTLQDNVSNLWADLAYAYSHALQFENAFVASDKAIAFAKTNSQKASHLSGKASDEQRYGLAEKSKETSKEVLTLLLTQPENQWDEGDFFSYALACQILGQYEVALEYYEKYSAIGYHEYDSSLYYNKACVYARLGNREDMIAMIRKAIQSDNIDWIAEVRHDLDFQAYWQDTIWEDLQKEYEENLPF